jgi:amino acid adenylation domain-containing protein
MSPDDPVPATPAQQRLWVLAEMRPGDPFYNIPFAVDITGPLRTPALERALDDVVRRHPPLRTTFRRHGSELLAQTSDAPRPATPLVDLADLAETHRERRAAELAAEFAGRPFDLGTGPLLRTLLLRLAPDAHRLLVNVHHIVFDGQSLEVFLTELLSRYEEHLKPTPADPPPLPTGVADVARARQAARERGGAAEALRYWTARLAGAPEVMELPISAARPAETRHEAAYRSRLIPQEVLEPLRRLARGNRATMFMVLKAACDVLLRQHGARDVVMGLALSGRDSTDQAGLIGYLAQPVVQRQEFTGDPTFRELLARVRADVLDAHEHPELPFEAVLQALGVAHDPSYYPLYQVMFGYQPRQPVRRAGGAEFAVSYLRLPTAKVELEFTLAETEDGLDAQIGYRSDLFDATTIEQMLARLHTLLVRVGEDPDARVSQLILPSEAEWHQVVVEWNRTRADHPRDRCIHHLVEDQVDRTPDAVAAQAGDRRWTYRQLDEAANRVAHHLREAGVGPEVAVGVCLPRSLELLAALLGVFKAGGVYVPLDPALPVQRLRTLVEDARPAVIVADDAHAPLFDGVDARIVAPRDTADRPTGRVGSTVVAANAAYLLYTSGSTGRPKGVVLEHRNLTNLLTWAHRTLGTELFRSVPLISSLAFDVSMWEIFTPLTCGGMVVVAEDAFALARTPGAETTTLLTAVPSVLTELLRAGGLPPSARTVVSNGEVLPPSVLRDLYDTPHVDLVYNMYAPTETTTFSLYNVVRPGEPIPIGRPMDNTVAYVLDAAMRPVPPGVVGQLYLGGAGVSRGYLNRPDLTAERFVPDPFGGDGQRLYATGDLVRHGPDGRILFVGRVDHQVKLRGCRIELGEVESTLLAHPDVAESCAVVIRRRTGDALAAAVMARDGATVEPAQLRAFLQARLPGYMVPEHLQVLPELPRLSSGKLDRTRVQRLLAEAAAAPDDEPPTGDTEQRVAAIWAELLGRAVGATENFFDAGGNSLLLVRLRERLRAEFRCEAGVVDLFRHPTVRAMAEYLTDAGSDGASLGDAAAERGRARQQARLLAGRRAQQRGEHATR